MPFYHRRDGRLVTGEFLPDCLLHSGESRIRFSTAERRQAGPGFAGD